MKFFILSFLCIFNLHADTVEEEVKAFIKQLDGNFKERKAASQKLYRLPVEYYPYLKKYLESGEVSVEVKLRLSKEKMYPLRAKWIEKNRAAWYRKNLLDFYKNNGKKNARWDKNVYAVINMLLEQFESKSELTMVYGNKISKDCSKALKSGCEEPIIKFYWLMSRAFILAYRDIDGFRKSLKEAQISMIGSNYHDYFKFRASLMAGKFNVIRIAGAPGHTKEIKAASDKYFRDALQYIPLMIKDKDLPFKELSMNLSLLYEEMRKNGTPESDAFKNILSPVEEKFGKESFQYIATEGMLLLAESNYNRIDGSQELAIRSLAKAWRTDPAELVTAESLLSLALSLDHSEKITKWYKNLTLADPANKNAFDARIEKARSTSSSSAIWEYANEIAESGTLMVTRLDQLFIKLYSKYEKDPERLFKRGATYENKKVKDILDRGFSGYLKKNPDDEDIKIEYAYYSALYGHWEQADRLFKSIGNIERYKGELDLKQIKELSQEAANYIEKKITPASIYFVDYKEKVLDAYQKRIQEGKYNFAQLYTQQNKDADQTILDNLKLHSDYWYDKPIDSRNIITVDQDPCFYFEEQITSGNSDPLLKFLWAVHKDQNSEVENSKIFAITNDMFKSKYPDHLKQIAICRGLMQLSYQSNKVTEEEKKQAEFFVNVFPDLVDKTRINILDYHSLIRGAKRLKLDHLKLINSLKTKFKSLGMIDYFHVMDGLSYEISSYDFYGKNWQEAHRLENLGKKAMKKAWFENPRHPGITSRMLFLSREKDYDYEINLRRSMNEVTNTYRAVQHYLYTAGFSQQYASWNVDFPHVFTKVPLLYCYCVNHHAFRNKKDKDYRSRYWKGVNIEYNRYLDKFPNDTKVRSEYALFAIQANKADVAGEQLKILGKYANEKVFKGRKKLEEYRKKYLKE